MIDAQTFARRNAIFRVRDLGVIDAALERARLTVSLQVCIDARGGDATAGESLYDAIVEADARVQLMGDPNGLPTSVTKDSNLGDHYRAELIKLKRLATPRGLVLGRRL